MPKTLKITLLIVLTFAATLIGYVLWKFNEIKNAQTYFDNLEEALRNPTRVNVLIVRNQNMILLPEEIKHLSNLRVLNLANNKLVALPESIGDLKNLEELFVANNQLKKFPSSLKILKKLRVINASNNLLNEVPREVYGLPRLLVLNLASNRIQNADVGAFKFLEDLDLSDNSLEKLSFTRDSSCVIKRLDLYNNKLVTVPENVFKLSRLNELILSGNSLDPKSKALYESFLKVRQ